MEKVWSLKSEKQTIKVKFPNTKASYLRAV